MLRQLPRVSTTRQLNERDRVALMSGLEGVSSAVDKTEREAREAMSAVEQLRRFGTIRKVAELDANGEYRWEFGLELDSPPSLHALYFEVDDKMPIIIKGRSWVMKGNKYAGVVFKAYRSQRIPAVAPVTGLLAAITGAVFNSLAAILNNWTPFHAPSDLKGVGIHVTASPT